MISNGDAILINNEILLERLYTHKKMSSTQITGDKVEDSQPGQLL